MAVHNHCKSPIGGNYGASESSTKKGEESCVSARHHTTCMQGKGSHLRARESTCDNPPNAENDTKGLKSTPVLPFCGIFAQNVTLVTHACNFPLPALGLKMSQSADQVTSLQT